MSKPFLEADSPYWPRARASASGGETFSVFKSTSTGTGLGWSAASWRFAVILAVGIVLRLACARDSFWVDEVASTHFAGQPLSHLWSDWMRRETNPPLYYTILKGWMALVGNGSDQLLRLLSLAYGCGAMILAGLLARRIAGPWAGLAAAALMAVSPAQVHYSLEVRGFAQAQFAALVALHGAIAFFSTDRAGARRSAMLLYGIGTLAAIHSHTLLLLLPVLVNFWALPWLATRPHAEDRPWRLWIGGNALVLLLSSWWLSITLWQMDHAKNLDWIGEPSLTDAAAQLQTAFGPDWPRLPATLQDAAVLLAGAISVAALLMMARRYGRTPALPILLCAVGAPTLLFLLSLYKPVMIPRAFFWASAPFCIAVALGLCTVRRRGGASVLLGLLLLVQLSGTLNMVGRADGEPFRLVVADLSDQPRAPLIADGMETALALQRYCDRTHCPLEIIAIAARESWTVGAPMRRIAARDMPALLACKGNLYTLQRPLGAEKVFVPESQRIKHDLSNRYGPGNYLKVARLDWTGNPTQGRPCIGADGKPL